MAKQVYRVKYDGRKKKNSDLNVTIEKPITLLKNLAINGEQVEKSSINIVGTKSEQEEARVPKMREELPLSKTKLKSICSIGLPRWQEKELQKLSAEKLKERGLAWVPKGSIEDQKDGDQTGGASQTKSRRRKFKKQSLNWKFAPNHQNYWS